MTAVFFTTIPQILHFAANLLFSRRYESKERRLYSRWILRPPGPFRPLLCIFNVDSSASELWFDKGIGLDIVFKRLWGQVSNAQGAEKTRRVFLFDNCSKICIRVGNVIYVINVNPMYNIVNSGAVCWSEILVRILLKINENKFVIFFFF